MNEYIITNHSREIEKFSVYNGYAYLQIQSSQPKFTIVENYQYSYIAYIKPLTPVLFTVGDTIIYGVVISFNQDSNNIEITIRTFDSKSDSLEFSKQYSDLI